jgi:N-acetyl-gamma-glutamylphosphate reductase
MNASSQGQMRLVIVGATGMVGGYALRHALHHPSVGVVTATHQDKRIALVTGQIKESDFKSRRNWRRRVSLC